MNLTQFLKNKIEAEKKADARYQRGFLLTDEQKFRSTVDNMTRNAFLAMKDNPSGVIAWQKLMGKPVTEENVRSYIERIGLRCKLMGNI